MENTLRINHLAILVCVILSFIIGYIWYTPLFGEQWMAMVGLDQATIEANPPGAGIWITNLLSSLVPLYVLAWIYVKLDIRNGIKGASIALLVSFSFHFLPGMTSDLFAKAPYELIWITGGFSMVFMTISGFILGSWIKTKSNE
jgi:hypothetical protein